MRNLWYFVEKQVSSYDWGGGELNGWKTIFVYEIVDNLPKLFTEIEAKLENYSENEIQVYLDENGYGDEEFNIESL